MEGSGRLTLYSSLYKMACCLIFTLRLPEAIAGLTDKGIAPYDLKETTCFLGLFSKKGQAKSRGTRQKLCQPHYSYQNMLSDEQDGGLVTI